MINFNEKKASDWKIERVNKSKYIAKRSILYGIVSLLGVNLFSPMIYLEDIFMTAIFFLGCLIVFSSTFGLLMAVGDWKSNEEKYQNYLSEKNIGFRIKAEL